MKTPHTAHPTDLELARWVAGDAAPGEREAWTAHALACDPCNARWLALAAVVEERAEGAGEPGQDRLDAERWVRAVGEALACAGKSSGLFRRRAWVPLACAASLLALIAAVWMLSPPKGGPGRKPLLPAGRPVAGISERLETDADKMESFHLADGSRFRLGPLSRAAFRPPSGAGAGAAGAARVELELLRGKLEAEVEKGRRAVEIRSGAGRIVVMGTRFTARAFRIWQEPEADPIPVLSVEVSEGAVDLVGEAGSVRVASGRRGILAGKDPPLLQEVGVASGRDDPVYREREWEEGSLEFGRMGTAILLVRGCQGREWREWEEILGDRTQPAARRRLAAVLVGASGEPEDAQRLSSHFARETDARVRLELVAPLSRMLGERAREFLVDAAGSDADEKVRGLAGRMLRLRKEKTGK